MLNTLTHRDFEAHLGTPFTVEFDDGSLRVLTLIEVNTIGATPKPNSDLRQAFSIVFGDPDKESYLLQNIYPLKHHNMGALDIFLVPLGPDQDGMRYEAVFT